MEKTFTQQFQIHQYLIGYSAFSQNFIHSITKSHYIIQIKLYNKTYFKGTKFLFRCHNIVCTS